MFSSNYIAHSIYLRIVLFYYILGDYYIGIIFRGF